MQQGRRILIVGIDAEGSRLGAALAFLGDELVSCGTGGEALRLLMAQVFHGVIMNAELPDIPAEEVIRRIRELLRQTGLTMLLCHPPDVDTVRGHLLTLLQEPVEPMPAEARELQRRWGALKESFRSIADRRLTDLAALQASVHHCDLSPRVRDRAAEAAREVAVAAGLFGKYRAEAAAGQLVGILQHATPAEVGQLLPAALTEIFGALGFAAADPGFGATEAAAAVEAGAALNPVRVLAPVPASGERAAAFPPPVFSDVFARYQKLAERHNIPLSLAVLVIQGRGQGSQPSGAITASANRLLQALNRSLRHEDIVAQWGKGQLVVGMIGAGKLGAAERLAVVVGELETSSDPEGGKTRWYGGVAEDRRDGRTLADLLAAAGVAVNHAMASGRGTVWASGTTGEEQTESVDVAVVDGDAITARLIEDVLVAQGFKLRIIGDGLRARSLFLSDPPGLKARVILLDIQLSGLDGLTLLRLLKEAGALRGARVIILTSRTSEAETIEGLQAGAWDYMGKPFNPRLLVERVRRALDGR